MSNNNKNADFQKSSAAGWGLLRNNLLISFRHLKADKTNSIISISGLVLGLAIVAIVLVFVLNELGYNSSFANRDRIYRVLNHNADDNNTWANTPFAVGETAANQLAEVEQFAHQYNIGNIEVKVGNEFVPEDKMLCTESSFFSMFGVEIIEGSLADFDHSTGKILLGKTIAKKYFKLESPIGQMLTLRYSGKEFPMEVIGVYKDFPKNSTIQGSLIAGNQFGFEHLVSNMVSTGEKPNVEQLRNSWELGLFSTNYLLLKKGTLAKEVETKLHQLGISHSTKNNKISLSLQPLSDIYFRSDKISDNNRGDRGNLSMLYILAVVGILILIIACINYLNLAAAQAMTQAKGFAVRKVCGASQKSLIVQRIFESSLISFISLPFAFILAHISLPLFSEMLGKSYTLTLSNQLVTGIAILLLITIFTGTLSGILVSLRFSTFRMVEILKGQKTSARNKYSTRKAMVVFQITVFIALIATMILVQKQVNYAFKKDMGFVKEGLVRIPLGDHNYELFKQEIRKNPNILNVSGALWIPPHKGKMNLSIPKVDNPNEMVTLNGLFVDANFAETMGLKITMGSDFKEGANNNGVLVNESAIKALGLKEVIGEQTAFGPIIGVVNDFNMYSIREAITPMLIGYNPNMCREIAVKINTENIPATINFLKKTWNTTGGTTPFDFDFTNDILNQLYDSDIRFSKTIGLLAIIAIAIASLGLFGLSLFMGRQRTKEIGIRKVNGARISEVLIMLNRDFVKWVAIAFVIATPIAYFAMNKWLENFAYKTTLSWWIFALAGLLALGIALLTVSWQSWRAATRNPVEALRYE
jgi:putative ABC transport system permease protein